MTPEERTALERFADGLEINERNGPPSSSPLTAARLRELLNAEKEAELWRAVALGKHQTVRLYLNHDKPLTAEARFAPVSLVAASLRQVFDLSHAKSYLEVGLEDDIGKFIVTVQKQPAEETPATRAERFEKALDQALDALLPFFNNGFDESSDDELVGYRNLTWGDVRRAGVVAEKLLAVLRPGEPSPNPGIPTRRVVLPKDRN